MAIQLRLSKQQFATLEVGTAVIPLPPSPSELQSTDIGASDCWLAALHNRRPDDLIFMMTGDCAHFIRDINSFSKHLTPNTAVYGVTGLALHDFQIFDRDMVDGMARLMPFHYGIEYNRLMLKKESEMIRLERHFRDTV